MADPHAWLVWNRLWVILIGFYGNRINRHLLFSARDWPRELFIKIDGNLAVPALAFSPTALN